MGKKSTTAKPLEDSLQPFRISLTELVQWIPLALFVYYLLKFAFPAYYFDGDDASFALQAHRNANYGESLREGYRYSTSPLLYHLLAWLKGSIDWDAIRAFQWLSLLGVVGSVFLFIRINQKFLELPPAATVVAAALFPEILISGLYSNDVAVAMLFFSIALWIRLNSSSLATKAIALLFYSWAILSRVDFLLLAPAFFVMNPQYWPQLFKRIPSSLSKKAVRSKWKALSQEIAILLCLVGIPMLLAGGGPLQFWRYYLSHLEFFAKLASTNSSDSFLALFPPPSILALLLSLIGSFKQKRPWIYLSLVAFVPAALFYLPALTTPKYLVPQLFFFLPIVANFWAGLFRQLRAHPFRALIALLIFAPFLGTIQDGRVLVGDSGRWLSTHDGPRLMSGIWRIGPIIRSERQQLLAQNTKQWRELLAWMGRPENMGKRNCILRQGSYVSQTDLLIRVIDYGFQPEHDAKYFQRIDSENSSRQQLLIVMPGDKTRPNCFIWN